MKKLFSENKNERKPFTLIELLTVIAIIAILCALLFPALSHAKALAHGTQCRGNMKNQYAGYSLYLNTYNLEMPYILRQGGHSCSQIQQGMTAMLKPELEINCDIAPWYELPKLWNCPGKRVDVLNSYIGCGPGSQHLIDYAIGYCAINGKPQLKLVNPSKKILGMDGAHTEIFHVGEVGMAYAWHGYHYVPGAGKFGLAEWPTANWTSSNYRDFSEGRHALTVSVMFYAGNIEQRSAIEIGREYHSPSRVISADGNPVSASACVGNMFKPEQE